MTLQVCSTQITHVSLAHTGHARSRRTFVKGFNDHPKRPVPSVRHTGKLVPTGHARRCSSFLTHQKGDLSKFGGFVILLGCSILVV